MALEHRGIDYEYRVSCSLAFVTSSRSRAIATQRPDVSGTFLDMTIWKLTQRLCAVQEASKAQKASDDNTLHPNELLPCIQVPQSWGGGLIRGSIPCIEFLEEGELAATAFFSAVLSRI